MATPPEQLCEEDFYAWTRDQAQALGHFENLGGPRAGPADRGLRRHRRPRLRVCRPAERDRAHLGDFGARIEFDQAALTPFMPSIDAGYPRDTLRLPAKNITKGLPALRLSDSPILRRSPIHIGNHHLQRFGPSGWITRKSISHISQSNPSTCQSGSSMTFSVA